MLLTEQKYMDVRIMRCNVTSSIQFHSIFVGVSCPDSPFKQNREARVNMIITCKTTKIQRKCKKRAKNEQNISRATLNKVWKQNIIAFTAKNQNMYKQGS